VGLSIPFFGGVASALPNQALTASPTHLDFGRVRAIQGIVSESVTITNVAAERLAAGRYILLGDVNLPAGFRIEPRMSTCIASGGSLSGTTIPLGLNLVESCTFDVLFDPTQLRSGTYTARLNVTIGHNKLRVLAQAQLVRIIG
jgi:hypothetical protein